MAQRFDVFLSYNTRDRLFVQSVRDELSKSGVDAWFDVEQLVGGVKIGEAIDLGLRASRTVVVLVGPQGFSDYQNEEAWAAIETAIKGGVRVLAVLLPGFTGAPEKTLPSALTIRKWLQFTKPVTEDDAFEDLMRAVLHDVPDDRLAKFLERRKKPVDPGEKNISGPPVARTDVDMAIRDLASAVKLFGTLTVFIGAGSSDPRPHDIARGLLTDLAAGDYGARALLPSLDVAGSYFEIAQGTAVLEATVVDLIRRGTQNAQPRLQALIARLVDRLSALGAKRRPRPEAPLIVTTAIDIMTERALLRAGVSFTRIVQGWSGSEITINEYKDVTVDDRHIAIGLQERDKDGRLLLPEQDVVLIEDTDALDDVIRMRSQTVVTDDNRRDEATHPIRGLVLDPYQSPDKPPRPILYKYHGSQDVPGSCALSAEQYFTLGERRPIPNRIVQMIGNSSGLFFLGGGTDADVRHAYQTLLRRAYVDNKDVLKRYAITRPARDPETDSYRQIESQMWPAVVEAVRDRMKIKVLETNAEAFLSGLLERLA